ncbi:MAG: threonine/serine dehydratase [Chloroherpetonaceae bacterium]|nr:threonine/serine dehydratase [Chloroherpetonaceae bacterium]MDW8018708.1 threonine/serine dehydratase [Chloroherpetonaceae bacterium]
MLIEKSEIEAAAARLKPYLLPTPVIPSRYFTSKLGAQLFLKLETLQPTNSFKVRGATNAILALSESQRQRGVISASAGNHGMAVALAANKLGLSATIYLPEKTPKVKLERIERLGAQIVLHGESWDEANALAMSVADQEGKAYIPAFDHLHVMAGQGTIVLELITQLPKIDAIVVSIGGGGLISGIISAVRHFSPHTKVYGVETEGANRLYLSRAAGRIVELPAITSVAESLGARKTGQRQFEIITNYVEDLVVVSDEEAIQSLLELLQEEKLLVEPAASCCIAALLTKKIPVQKGETIVAIMCGANVALERVVEWYEAEKMKVA